MVVSKPIALVTEPRVLAYVAIELAESVKVTTLFEGDKFIFVPKGVANLVDAIFT